MIGKLAKLLFKTILGLCLVMIALIPIISGCTFSNLQSSKSDSTPSGKIIFQWVKDYTSSGLIRELILMDGNGQNIHHIGIFTGSPAFSPDGNRIAIGCPTEQLSDQNSAAISTEICILEIEMSLDDVLEFPEETNDPPYEVTDRLSLPEQCWGQNDSWGYNLNKGILSITWSPQADRLAIVCEDITTSDVCILSMSGEARCWGQAAAEGIYRVSWSPTDENILLTSGGQPRSSDIFLISPDGTNKRFLTTGWSPEWSPNGSKIAYIEKQQETDENSPLFNIAVINSDGSGHEWLYQPDPQEQETVIYFDYNRSFSFINAVNVLAWSPDAKHLVFSGVQYHKGMRLYRLDMETGEIVILVYESVFENWVAEPDWGP